MATIAGLYRRFQAFDGAKAAEAAMSATTVPLLAINKEQMKAGYNRFDEKIGDSKPYKNADYAFEKYRLNPLPGLGNPDLDLTGSFQAEMAAIVANGTLSIKSADPKNDKLTSEYPDIFGLGGPFKVKYLSEDLRPAFSNLVFLAVGIKPR